MIEGLSAYPFIWPLALLAIGTVASLIGGALSGYTIAGRDLGAEVSTQIGGLFGMLSGIPGIALALLILALMA